MFKRRLAALLVAVLALSALSAAGPAPAADYQADVHYKKVADDRTEEREIREFFSFWCGHCHALHGQFAALAEKFSGRASFIYNPIEMLGGPMGAETQKGYAVALLLGMDAMYSERLFELIHVQHKYPRSHQDMANFFASLGVPLTRFEQEYNSFALAGLVSGYNSWVRKAGIEAVPELLVNGKYLVIMEAFDSADDLAALIEYLLDLE